MKNNLYLFVTVFSISFSFILGFKYFNDIKLQSNIIVDLKMRYEHLISLIEKDNISWFSNWPVDSLFNEENRLFNFKNNKNSVVIVFSNADKEGCKACLSLEATDWKHFHNIIKNDSTSEKFDICLILCKIDNKMRILQELKAMKIDFPVFFDDEGAIFKDVGLDWSPAVVFLRYGKVVNVYTGDMNNRRITEQMMSRYKFFLNN